MSEQPGVIAVCQLSDYLEVRIIEGPFLLLHDNLTKRTLTIHPHAERKLVDFLLQHQGMFQEEGKEAR